MFSNPNIIEKIDIDNSQFILKIKDPQFHLVYPSYTCESNPIVIKTERNDQNHTNKTVFVIAYHPRYFHTMMEFFPMILTLREQVQDFTVVITYEAPVDPETGLFVTMLDNHPQPEMVGHCPVAPFPQLFIHEFFKYFEIDFICMNTEDIKYKSFDYCYLFYVKNESTDGKNFLYDEGREFSKDLQFDYFHPLFMNEVNPLYRFTNNIKLLRKYLSKYKTIKNQKIYISRKNFSGRSNPEEIFLEEYFYNKGYNVVYLEKMGLIEQIKLVQESEKIVCIFGSALVNCMLGSSQNNVISIRPFDFQATFYKHIFNLYSINYKEIVYKNGSLLDLVKDNEDLW